MVERSRRGKGKQKLLGSHQRCWLWGRNLVRETLLAGRWPILELHLADDLPDTQLEEALRMAAGLHVRAVVEGRDVLKRLCHTSEHQGFLAKLAPFPYASAEAMLATNPEQCLHLVLDSIQDPYNFGAVLRSAAAFAVNCVFVGRERQVSVTSMVARSSAGGVNCVPIAQVDDLPALLHSLRGLQIQVIGATEKAAAPLTACNFQGATAIVIGNEGTGIRPEVLACCNELARIPLSGTVASLNASAATTVFLHEVQRQRELGDRKP